MEGYNWTPLDTPGAKERLAQILDGLKSPDFVVGALSYRQGERFICQIWPKEVTTARHSLESFLNDRIPIKEFLDPSPPEDPRIGEMIPHLSNALAYPVDYKTHLAKAIECLGFEDPSPPPWNGNKDITMKYSDPADSKL